MSAFTKRALTAIGPYAKRTLLQQIVQARLRAIEEQVKSKSGRGRTLALVKLEQLKERVRQLGETARPDRQRILDKYNRRPSQTASGGDLSMDIGSIQMQIGRRGVEKQKPQERIANLATELGLTGTAEK